MNEPKIKKFTYFIGIDVSKNELDFAVMQGKKFLFHKETKNDRFDIADFVIELKKLPRFTLTKAVFCMEQTGIYCNHLITTLKKFKANIVKENALQIRNSLGVIRGKYDKIDAIRIAHYLYINRENIQLFQTKRPVIETLHALCTLRNRLVSINIALKTPLVEQAAFIAKGANIQTTKACKRSADAITLDLVDLDVLIDTLIRNDEHLTRLNEIICSVPSIGKVTAAQIIICTNEFKSISDPKKFACYSGVAPFKRESGLMKGRTKVSNIANKKMKSLLHICALTAIRWDTELKEYYQRRTQGEGRAKMAIINAVRYKLILRIFACVHQNRLYQKDYISLNQNISNRVN